MKKILTLLTVIISILAASCDYVKEEIPKGKPGGTNDTSKAVYVRKILLEDHTAHKCPNCPDAAALADKLKYEDPTKYGDRLVVIDVNAGMLALPSNSGSYTYDFRCPVGNQLYGYFLPPYQPYGLINRRGFPSGDPNVYWYDRGVWADTIKSLINTAPDADIKITNDYISASRILNTTIRSKFLKPQSGKFNLVVYLTEDSIIAWQTVKTVDEPNYMHRYTLRDALNGSGSPWGDVLNTNTVINTGDSIVKTYTYALPAKFNNNSCDEKHCHIIAFIVDSDPSSKKFREVMQVEDKKIIIK